MKYDIFAMEKTLSRLISERRFHHSLGVQGMSVALAARYEADIDRANIAGLLHDCAKDLKDEELVKECKKLNIPVTDVECRNGYLLHGKLGAYYAKHKFGVDDNDILSAIIWHTTGKPDMSLLEKIVFVADYIEPSRSQERIPNLNEIRVMAFADLNRAIIAILKNTIDYLEKKGQEIDHSTYAAYEYYNKI
ncbi:MAG: bis(5'-nucleosyl)-tetraphosphatase (symmetrical) [Lachnoclostridium sp.]|jgi:predicted HD superfamily hydrolase involved in NAD metabolism